MVALIIALLENPAHVCEVKRCLEQAGHDICIVNSFAKATAALQDRSFDLIISDAHLENGGSVFDFLKWVKSNQHLKSIPFVLFSLEPTELAKYLADGVRTTARLMGAAKYIFMERFDAELLTKEVAELLPSESVQVQVLRKEGD